MGNSKEPSLALAKKTLPAPLLQAIDFIFSEFSDGCCLVGGTALAGFYAGHRRSDDIDLFTKDEFAQIASVRAVQALVRTGAELSNQRESRQYFHCLATLKGHRFTVDVVLDPHFHAVPSAIATLGNIRVATLEGILSMKMATLVSRCSEKDLYDLSWLFDNFRKPAFAEFVELGRVIDTGVNEESILISLSGSQLRESACLFAEQAGVSAHEVFQKVATFRDTLIREYSAYLREKPEHHKLKNVLDKLRS